MSEVVTHESWFSRLGNSIKGVLVGVAIFLVAFPLLWWNEGCAIKTAKTRKVGANAVHETTGDRVNPEQECKVVHLTGEATTDEVLKDPQFHISANAIRLTRKAEMCQWEETKSSETREKMDGVTGTVTTYSYRKTWSDRAIDSDSFHEPGHDNPGTLPVEELSVEATDVRLGKYQLPGSLVSKIQGSEPLPLKLEDLPKRLRSLFRQFSTNGFYFSPGRASGRARSATARDASPNTSAQIGDIRVTFFVTRPATVSIMSAQAGNSFAPFETSKGRILHLLEMGAVPASEMIAAPERPNMTWTWALRGVGFVLMGVGLGLVLKPMSVLADEYPIVGDFVNVGIGRFSFIMAGACWLGSISLVWLFYRPLIGVPLLAAGIGLVVVLAELSVRAHSSSATTPTALRPSP